MRTRSRTEKPKAGGSLVERLAELDARIAATHADERAVGRREAELKSVERAARERLVSALADDADGVAERKELEQARANADQPWPELRQAHARKVASAKGERIAFLEQNLDALLAELRPQAERLHAALVAGLDEVLRAHAELAAFVSYVNGIGVAARGPQFRVPEPGIDEVIRVIERAEEVRPALGHATPIDPTIRSSA